MREYKLISLEEIPEKTEPQIRGSVEVTAIPVYMRELPSLFKWLFGPRWEGVLESNGKKMFAKSSRFDASFFPTKYDLLMLAYASETKQPVTFRGKITGALEGCCSNMGGATQVLKVNGFKIGDYRTINFQYQDAWNEN